MNEIISLDYQSRIPIYEQIIKEIERYVALKILKPNEQIPSIRELAANLGINPNTVKKAYTELEQKGVIYVISTKGTFIAENTNDVIGRKVAEGINSINKIVDELEKLGVSKEEILRRIK